MAKQKVNGWGLALNHRRRGERMSAVAFVQMTTNRSILHIDMDAFYVSVELLRHPELRGQPVVVGGTGGRGVVAAASYEARRYGIHSALSSAIARKLCPDAVFLPPDISHYVEFSQRLHTIFETFTPLVEQISIDEAFLDVTGASMLLGDAVSIAWALRERVVSETQLTCSVGVAPNKFLAKLASEHAKPRALAGGVQRGYQVFEVKPGNEKDFLLPLAVQSLWGVGPATLSKLEAIGVRTVADLAELDVGIVCAAVGDVNGRHLHALAQGIDDRIVQPERIAKSIGHEETFSTDLTTHDELRVQLVRLCDAVARRTRDAGVAAGTLLLKVKFSSFESVTRSVTPTVPLTTGPSMVAALEPLLAMLDYSQGVRLLGVHAQKLTEQSERTPRLFDDGGESPEDIEEHWKPASRAVDLIVDRFGAGMIGPVSGLHTKKPGQSPSGPVAE
jgi:DNA polymerase-4